MRLRAIYENCLAHMMDTYGDWEKAFDALRGAVRKNGDRPEDMQMALEYYSRLEQAAKSGLLSGETEEHDGKNR